MVQLKTILGKQDWEINLLLLKIFFSNTLQVHKNISQPKSKCIIDNYWLDCDRF